MTRPHKTTAPAAARYSGPAVPDRRLSSVFTKRSTTAPATARSVGILSTYGPTICGVANFTQSLSESLMTDRADTSIGVVRLGQDDDVSDRAEVVYELPSTGPANHQAAARILNTYDVVLIQHEFGIYRGDDGAQVLEILDWICVPVVVVLHTVPSNPTPGQRAILERLTSLADGVVTMSETGRRRLLADYPVRPSKVMLIPHGARPVARDPQARRPHDRRPMILTWGLLGPGKGIEWGIDAMARLRKLRTAPRYVVAGQTHPKVLANQGEAYRTSLAERAQQQQVPHMVEFEPGYLSNDRLLSLVREADVVLLPYDSSEQITSGVLVEAIAANVPVVSTAFPHAQELLAGDKGGLLVPHQDSAAIARAVNRVLTEPGLANALVAASVERTAVLNWELVSSQYRQLFDALLRRPAVPVR